MAENLSDVELERVALSTLAQAAKGYGGIDGVRLAAAQSLLEYLRTKLSYGLTSATGLACSPASASTEATNG